MVVVLASFLIAARTGPTPLSAQALLGGMIDQSPLWTPDWAQGLSKVQEYQVFAKLRLPRVVLGAFVGAALATAGTAFQAVLRNPLADPYLLGVSSGAGVAVTTLVSFAGTVGFVATQGWIAFAGFLGGIIAVAATLIVSRSVGRGHDPLVVILAGVAIAALCNAVQTFLQQANDQTLRRVYSWMLGHLSTAGWSDIKIIAAPIVVAISVLWVLSRLLDALLLGDIEAATLGLNPEKLRLLVMGIATVCTACAVAASGLIGFVGLVVPHAVRLIVGSEHRILLPLSSLYGAAFLILADALGRTVISPAEVPIGVITAFIGAPFFLFLLYKARN